MADGSEEKPKRPRNLYGHVRDAWAVPRKSYVHGLMHDRKIAWRQEPSFQRVPRPTRLDRARALGYKAKEGFVVVRARVRRGGLRKPTIRGGRRPKRKGISKITMAKSLQRIAEERVARRYPNLEVLNSYWVADDGRHKYYEVLLVDPHHPAIQADKELNWVRHPANRSRVYRGLTSAGKRGRGLRKKGRGAEKVRPSARRRQGRGPG